MFKIFYSDQALKNLKKIEKKWQIKIMQAIEGLKQNPFEGKKLQGKLIGLFSLRVWPYRIIYILEKQKAMAIILDIGHRQGVYN
ncbi:type II toxin-antitoxin system RelE/ParE family toxin [Candidatus Peregrinibacteria bacterium]|nr:type II toxin-antitoxin system RelE/ParE family toxin [Candidatus Peregrinibacteria bacterium]